MRRHIVGLTLAISLLLVSLSVWGGCHQSDHSTDDFPSDVASVWFDTLYDVIKSEGTTPPPASRIYGVVAVALYEAVVPGALHHRSLVGQLNGLAAVPQPPKDKKHHWPTVANAALAWTIRGIFSSLKPQNLNAINALEQHFAAQFEAVVSPLDHERSVAQGQVIADALLAWTATDGVAIFNNCPYVPIPVPGAWEPTPPGFNPNPLQPCWGQIRPMVLTSSAECSPPGPPAFSTVPGSQFYAAALEVYTTGALLTDVQKTIANYWADGVGQTGTPPGHWIAIVAQISRDDGLSLMAAAEAFARVGVAVHDAFIECWHIKYTYDLQRPVTYINKHIDPTWVPYITTPGFPSYHSGHSTQSRAAAVVLTDLFGSLSFKDTTHTDHGLLPPQAPRTFSSFDEAADEAAASRLYGGIHYPFDNDDGLSSGWCIGDLIRKRVQFK
jgi:PAP2 superfamily protein